MDPTSEDVHSNGPVVGQERLKDFGDPFIPERVYNGWKGNKNFEMMKVILNCNGMLMVERESRRCRRIFRITIKCRSR